MTYSSLGLSFSVPCAVSVFLDYLCCRLSSGEYLVWADTSLADGQGHGAIKDAAFDKAFSQ